MQDIIKVEKIDEVYIKVLADPGVRQELSDYFAFRPSNYQFHPKFKAKVWDGFIRLYSPMKPVLYIGLLDYLKKFCVDREYKLEYNEKDFIGETIPDNYVETLLKYTNGKLIPRDFQNEYVLNAIRNGRSISLSPTSSGKSFIQFLIHLHYYTKHSARTLIIVPTVGLVHQMAGDFVDYGYSENDIHKIQSGVDKNINKSVTISTWQSLTNQPKEWFNQFQVILGDEVHTFAAKSLTTIMEKTTEVPWKHGFTGTISSESKVNKIVLEGLFGSVKKFISTKELIDKELVASFKVKALVLSYNNEDKKEFSKLVKEKKKQNPNLKNIVFTTEREFLFKNEKRNRFLKNLIHSLENKNNLILFDQIENHGKILEQILKKEGRILHFIYGNTAGEERERIRQEIENDPIKRHDILASFGVFSTGVSIKRIDTAIFASSYKSEIKVLQSIGRTLRRGNGSDDAVLYDITDDLSLGSFENYTLKHFKQRVEIYNNEQFDYKLYNIDL